MLKFFYNDRGHRVRKESFVNGSLAATTYYVRDASGSTLAVYENSTLAELPIYGVSRLGVYYKTGNRNVYQLTDHLGNIRAVITKAGDNAVISSSTDYYPFGMPMPGRQIVGGEQYRYSFQGQEKDPETGKEAFQLRLWDSRIGRWLTTDPYGQFASPYLGMGNNPINSIDPDGGFSWLGALWYKLWNGGSIEKRENDYGYYYVVLDKEYDTKTGLMGVTIAVGKGAIPTREGWIQAATENIQFINDHPYLNVEFTEDRWEALSSHLSMAMPSARFNGLLNATTNSFQRGYKAFNFNVSNATQAQLGALDHALKRHGKELGELVGTTLRWTKKANLQPVLDKFNDAVSIIAKYGKKVGTKHVAFGVKGSGQSNVKTLVNVHEYVHKNKTYYLYTRAKDNRFVSAGLKAR